MGAEVIKFTCTRDKKGIWTARNKERGIVITGPLNIVLNRIKNWSKENG